MTQLAQAEVAGPAPAEVASAAAASGCNRRSGVAAGTRYVESGSRGPTQHSDLPLHPSVPIRLRATETTTPPRVMVPHSPASAGRFEGHCSSPLSLKLACSNPRARARADHRRFHATRATVESAAMRSKP